MLPKIIHYCWFGKNPLPPMAKKCIESWQKYLPEYKIIQWNEDNFEFQDCAYAKQAYEEKKYAFVSDYVRYAVLQKYGGIYFDTDVELIKPLDKIVENGPFLGCEKRPNGEKEMVAPGVGMGAVPNMRIYNEILEKYRSMEFSLKNEVTVVDLTTNILKKYGYVEGTYAKVEGINIYPADFFCPLNYFTGEMNITENTVSIHQYSDSWHTNTQKKLRKLQQKYGENGEKSFFPRICIIYMKFKCKLEKLGILGTIHYLEKYFNRKLRKE